MSSLKLRQADGTFRDILMIKGDKGDAGIATEAINDTLTDTEHTWSSSKISTELATKANDIDLEIETVTADITIASLMQKVEVGKSKKFQYTNTNENSTDLPSDYPSIMLNAKAIFRPTITVNRITAGIMYLEIISPNQSTGVPKTITGYYNGAYYWNEELSMTNVANNLLTTQEGMVLDARQGKVLNDKIDVVNNNLTNAKVGKGTLIDTLASETGTGITYRVINGICYVHVEIILKTTLDNSVVISNLPSGTQIQHVSAPIWGTDTNHVHSYFVNNSIYMSGGVTGGVYAFSLSYPVI